MHLLSMLHEEMVDTVCSTGLTAELVHLHTLSSRCLIIEALLKKEGLNYGGREVWEAQRRKGMPVWKYRGSEKLETERRDFENYFVEIQCFLAWKYNDLLALLLSELQYPASTFRKLVIDRLWSNALRVLLYNLWASWCKEEGPKQNKVFLLALWSKLTFK